MVRQGSQCASLVFACSADRHSTSLNFRTDDGHGIFERVMQATQRTNTSSDTLRAYTPETPQETVAAETAAAAAAAAATATATATTAANWSFSS